jgi:hypothetical protein
LFGAKGISYELAGRAAASADTLSILLGGINTAAARLTVTTKRKALLITRIANLLFECKLNFLLG